MNKQPVRPCLCDNASNRDGSGTAYVTGECRLCWLWYDPGELGTKYRASWAQPEGTEPGWLRRSMTTARPSSASGRFPPDRTDRSRWPWTARTVALLASGEDRGLGDTIARHLERFGANALKRLYRELVGRDCGCGDRQAKLNQIFPYMRDAS